MIRKVYIYEDKSWNDKLDESLDSKNTLIICYGSSNFNSIKDGFNELVAKFPNSLIVGNSTSGEIFEDELYENTLSIAILKLEKSSIKFSSVSIETSGESFAYGASLSSQLEADDLEAVLVFSDGLNVNGSLLTKGINSVLDYNKVTVTGGLAGDDASFTKTWVLHNNEAKEKIVTAVGFYGDDINISYGSKGGWSKFGIDRMVTSSDSNILYKLDDKPALEVYKTYLGESAKDLPSSGLLYPLMIEEYGSINESKVRTILAVNEEDQSITFAGDIPNGSKVMFMQASFSELIDGATSATETIKKSKHKNEQAINLAISCVGRKLVLGQKTEDEIEAVYNGLDENVLQIGFYSYGEISPLASGACDLHNQTMTLTQIWENED